MRVYLIIISLSLCLLATSPGVTQPTRVTPREAGFPGIGLNQHPFLYCGEWQDQSLDNQTIYLVEKGRVVWTFTNSKHGELGDCTRLSNGNIVFSRQFGASEVTPDKTIV